MADNKQQLEKKVRKFFRKKQKEYSRLGSKGTLNELATKLPLDDYEEFVEDLTCSEFYEFFSIFQNKERVTTLMELITDTWHWFNRCCCDMRLIDDLSDEHFAEILNNEDIGSNDIGRMFNAGGQNMERRLKIVHLLDKRNLEKQISYWASLNVLSEFNSFLVFLYRKETHSEISSERAKAREIFERIASFSEALIAKLLVEIVENSSKHLAKRILQEVRNLNRNEQSIYARIPESNLFTFLGRMDFDFLDNADAERYTWVYEHIAEEDKEEFACYLADEKNSDGELFDTKICAEVYPCLPDSLKEDFLKKVFIRNNQETFMQVYERLSKDDKEEMFEILSKDEEGKEIIKCIIDSRGEDLTFFEGLVKEKYVTTE